MVEYENAKTELNYKNLYELLISVILSAQCTDKRVNLITPKLFEIYPSVEKLAVAELNQVQNIIQTCSFFNNKAKNIILMAQKVINDYNGQIPLTQKELMSLAGVGQKTANVIRIEWCEDNLMAVDTHVFRVSHRLGLSSGKNVKETEVELVKKLKDNLAVLHQAMVLFGRYKCKAINPECEDCILIGFCKTKETFKV